MHRTLRAKGEVGMARKRSRPKELIWACLVHLSYNMWAEEDGLEPHDGHFNAKPYLRFDTRLWRRLAGKMVEVGVNMVVIDLGDAVRYESHPEIAVRRAWAPSRLRSELERLRNMGLEPIPKLNFSTAHDAWLGPYSRCVSTEAYYRVCRDLIAETIELFDRPRLFHLGMDEETLEHQSRYQYTVVRRHDLWWHDLHVLLEAVEKAGARPWVWSDHLWRHPKEFVNKMPKSVLQSNWYYGDRFNKRLSGVKAILGLAAHGYDQIPTGSNWRFPENFSKTVDYCMKNIRGKRLLGFMQTIWLPTIEDCRGKLEEAIEVMGPAISKWSRPSR